VVVPDLPGCFSASDMGFDQAIECAHEAIERWIDTTLKMGYVIPKPSDISQLQKLKEFKGWKWAMVEFKP
jgi:predicted RNase H-like HicB family nuclease